MTHPLEAAPLAWAILLSIGLPVVALADEAAGPATDLDRIVVSETRAAGYATPPSATSTGLTLSPRQTPQSVSVLTRE